MLKTFADRRGLFTAAPSLINYRALGDGLREFSSTVGVIAGDCQWASAREEHWKVVNETWSANPSSTTTTNETAAEIGWMVSHRPVRRNLTSCGTFWRAETDAAVVANPVIAFMLHCARGVALFGLVEAFLGNVRKSSPQHPLPLMPPSPSIRTHHRSSLGVLSRPILHCCECYVPNVSTKLATGACGADRALRAASIRRFRGSTLQLG